MARSFNLKCRLFISSFRICRPKHQRPLSLPKTPSPANYHYTKQFPASPTSCYLCYPSPPSPPPSTPVSFFADPSSGKSSSVCCSCKLKSYARENGFLEEAENRGETEHKVSGEKKQRCFLFYCITRKKSRKLGLNRKPLTVKRWSKGYEGTEELVSSSETFSEGSPEKRVEGKMGQSFVEEKRSKNPREDFKRSMVQMILEKEIFEGKGLEELLDCYLRLNSPEYHRLIVGAFSEEIYELAKPRKPEGNDIEMLKSVDNSFEYFGARVGIMPSTKLSSTVK